MNCKTCQENAVRYQRKEISNDIRHQMEAHLATCESCQKFFAASHLLHEFTAKEDRVQVNPFLATRVMAQIESLESKSTVSVMQTARVQKLQPLLLAASVILAVFIGIKAGSFYKPVTVASQTPEELMYLNDAAMESLSVFMND